jgi:SlyX protein
MQTPPNTEQRLVELEIKVSYAEDTLDQLNQVIVRQQAEIELLQRTLRRLMEQAQDRADPTPRPPQDELPPHY